jgi:hypothetical protein
MPGFPGHSDLEASVTLYRGDDANGLVSPFEFWALLDMSLNIVSDRRFECSMTDAGMVFHQLRERLLHRNVLVVSDLHQLRQLGGVRVGLRPKTSNAELSIGLLCCPNHGARLRELIEIRAERTVVTRETLAAEIDQATERASDLDQPATVIAGAMAKAKLYGLEAPSKNVQMNINATFNQMTDEELRFELASLVNAVRAARGQPLVALPVRKGEEDENEKP